MFNEWLDVRGNPLLKGGFPFSSVDYIISRTLFRINALSGSGHKRLDTKC